MFGDGGGRGCGGYHCYGRRRGNGLMMIVNLHRRLRLRLLLLRQWSVLSHVGVTRDGRDAIQQLLLLVLRQRLLRHVRRRRMRRTDGIRMRIARARGRFVL